MSTLSYTYNLTANTPARASEVMQNLNDAKTVINGNIGPTNVDLTGNYPWTGIHAFDITDAKISGQTFGYLIPVDFFPEGTINIAFAQGSDSSQLKITSAKGAALSSTNPGYVRIRSSTAGTFRTFSVTADVTLDLTSAHWGLDTKGNVTGALLRIYAIDDNGTLVWGVGYQGGFYYIRNTQDDTAAANINLPEEIFTSANVATDNSPMLDVGHIEANFTDATNEWAITGYFPGLRSADGKWQPYAPAYTGFSANPSAGVSKWMQVGKTTFVAENRGTNGTSNATTYTFTLPIKSLVAYDLYLCKAIDNGTIGVDPGLVTLTTSSATASAFKTIAGGTWTNFGGKLAVINFNFEAYQP